MVKIKCKNCGGVGFKSYPFGTSNKARKLITHDGRCKLRGRD